MTVGMKPGHQARFVKTISEMSQGGTAPPGGGAAVAASNAKDAVAAQLEKVQKAVK